jgi:enoyl-CoA hydratase
VAYENILLEQVESGIYLLTINRPKAYNALNEATLREIGLAVDEVGAKNDARVLLITGAGDKAFVAGADIKEMASKNALEGRAFSVLGISTVRKLELLPFPVIAVVNGFALGGGCEISMACDWIIASESAVFGQPEVKLGVTPGFGGTQRLLRRVGTARAMELITTARQVKAEEALHIGLVNSVHPVEGLMDAAMAQARDVAAQGPVAVRLSKEVIQRGQDIDLETACLLETEVFGLCFATADQKEGMGAFVEKRAAKFENR